MTKINLIPKEAIIKEDYPELTILAVSCIALLIIVLGYSYTLKVKKRIALKREIEAVQNELAQLQTTIDQIARLKAQKDALNTKKTALEGLIKTRLVYPILMEDVVKILPAGTWLLNLNTKTGDPSTLLTFNATAYDNYIIADLLQALEDSQIFKNPEISGITSAASDKGASLKQFSINVNYINQEWK
ncbi:MAG: PilN domain-containing protein [Elusimicrobia bacterium]|nr:PilN domain-containing protein [Elusimicrobiota bacterium]